MGGACRHVLPDNARCRSCLQTWRLISSAGAFSRSACRAGERQSTHEGSPDMRRKHFMPFGAEVCQDGSVRFRLWAPKADTVDVLIENPNLKLPMPPIDNGWFELITSQVSAGACYRFQVNG